MEFNRRLNYEKNHTKGEWKITINEYDHPTSIKVDAEHSICTIRTNDQIEANANAKLIAAAPDLLEACYKALKELEYMWSTGNAKRIVKQAIDKATL